MISISALRFAGFSLVLCALGAMAQTEPSLQAHTHDDSPKKKLGIVSLIGTQLDRHYLGLTAFGNEKESIDITDWGLDSVYEAQLTEAILSRGKQEVTILKADRQPLLEKGITQGQLVDLAKEFGMDELLILSASERYKSARSSSAIGIAGHGRQPALIYIHARLRLIEGATGTTTTESELAWEPRKRSAAELLSGSGSSNELIVEATPDLGTLKLSEMTAYDIRRIKNALIELPKSAWQPTLAKVLK